MQSRIQKIQKKIFQPARVLMAILLAVLVWMIPMASPQRGQQSVEEIIGLFPQNAEATNKYACNPRVCGQCCIVGACVKCPEEPGDPLPPEIIGTLTCSQTGNNGWCIGTLTLDLTASDPQGQTIIISGGVNGAAFSCEYGDTNCSVPITDQGNGTVAYRVDSMTTLFDTGSDVYQLDSGGPQVTGSISGVSGVNSWYLSDVTFSASADDPVSGLLSFEIRMDGGVWEPYTAPVKFTEGTHSVDLRAEDNEGNITETTQPIQVDVTTPVINTSINGTKGANNWYVTNVTVSANATDDLSGLSQFEYAIDGVWEAYTAPITFTEGTHTYQFRAVDEAGNTTTTALQTIKVDTTTPGLSLSLTGTSGANDAASGISKIEASTNGGA